MLPRPDSGRGASPRPESGRGMLPRPDSGRGVLPRPESGRGVPRPIFGRGSPPPVVVASSSSYSVIIPRADFFSSFDKGDFHLEVIEAIRNLPDCSSDSLNISVESGSGGVGNSFLPLDEALDKSGVDGTESSVAPLSRPRCRAIDVDHCHSSVSSEELEILEKKINSSSELVFTLPSVSDRIKIPPPGFFTAYLSFFASGFTLPPIPYC
ncbi:UNVERIFIED_CONTAM: hypothetical protein Sradi_1460400 [Sesamum radiatum]|uniref:Uncharacterized protein n=2 Tax=Sesamum radiatum TaxID=300843 RepID=A0AAW2U6J2_SESRA